MPNRLMHEASPYLQQHAHNPVDWFPWGDEALHKATAEDKPIFLSIGYSACHWCHVMAHESFEDEGVAALLNEHFVSIKVDREERPDLDAIYMSAVQAITGRGGWPMSVFLTPQGEPFYGGTYFPPERRYGMPSFSDVLRAVADGWRTRREELIESGQSLAQIIQHQSGASGAGDGVDLSRETMQDAARTLRQSFDQRRGGWGGAPKFPQPMILEFLLRFHHSTGDSQALSMVTQTLEAMARGGTYDQLGGGFHRYSVDERWLVPHFEKMLYDNAQLARVYLHAWQVTGNEFFRTITEEILDYVIREMTDQAGGFYSTQDADTEGEEGKFFVWTPDEIRTILGSEADAFMSAYGVTQHGNFEGKNILELASSLEQRRGLSDARGKLFEARERRIRPGRDEKVLTSWNGLMLAAFAEAARALGVSRYRDAAERNAAFLLRELRSADGRLFRTWKAGRAKQDGFLEDYACLIEGLLAQYQTTFDTRWFAAARDLVESMLRHFQAPGGFYDTGDDHEALITRPRNLQDNASPSGSAMAATVLLKVAGLTGEEHYVDTAHQALSQVQPMMAKYPLGFGQWLQALSYSMAPPREIAIVGDPGSTDTQALLDAALSGYRPFQVVASGAAGEANAVIPLLHGRGMVNGKAAAYACRDFTCQAPVTQPERLYELLQPR